MATILDINKARKSAKPATPNGVILYRGPSALDGAPIIVIATGLAQSSTNEKTGGLVQTWIMRDDVSPRAAVNSGADSSVCGDCPHRGRIVDGRNVGRSCYVTIDHAPRNIWETAHRDRYPTLDVQEAAELLRGRKVRLGAYGDPAAVPLELWDAWLEHVQARTGYTHQWRTAPHGFARHCMASCETESDHAAAKELGYRTFRVRTHGESILPREVVCPASKEAGFKTTCDKCLACGGTLAKAKADIVIEAHGSAALVNAYNATRATLAA